MRSGEVADTYFRGYYHTYDGINTAFEIGRLPIRPALPLDAVESKLGLTVDYPYLDPRVRNFAMTLSREENVITRDVPGAFSDTPPGKGTLKNPAYILGKLALRRAMIGILPDEIVSRIKTEIEFGSGMANLRPYLRRQLGEGQREELEETDGVHFRNNAHAGIYVLYREAGLKPKPPKEGEYACTWCGGGVSFGPNGDNKYCSTCGAYPANKLPESH
ncbi:MAG TPA: asparagine synthase-related protein [Candidatus Acidoferrum sp.]|nr:asparagine synthase-related protein [Candidatus Acidoferrum sp.]